MPRSARVNQENTAGRARSTEQQSIAEAERAAEDAYEAFAHERFADAALLYERALRAAPSSDLLYNLARVHDLGLKDFPRAARYYERYLESSRSEQTRGELAARRLGELRGGQVDACVACPDLADPTHLPAVRSTAGVSSAQASGASVQMIVEDDPQALRSPAETSAAERIGPASFPVSSGTTDPPKADSADWLTGGRAQAIQPMEPEEPARAASRPRRREPWSPFDVAAVVLGSTGAANLALSAGYGLSALSELATVRRYCEGNNCSTQSGVDAARAANRKANAATVALSAGLGLTALGITLWWLGPPAASSSVQVGTRWSSGIASAPEWTATLSRAF